MRRLWVLCALALSLPAVASSTLRVGSQVLVTGDRAARAIELLGQPAHKSHHRATRHGRRGGLQEVSPAHEQWRYRRGDHVTTLTLVDGEIVDIEDRRR